MNRSEPKNSSLEQEKKLLAALLRKKAASEKRTFPMSMGQASLFMDYLAQLDNYYYNLSFSFKIESGIDAGILQKACQLMVDRHEILRTTYGFENDLAVQTVHGHRDAQLSRIHLTVADETVIRKRLIADARHPFDLFNGPVIRTNLYSIDPGKHYFLLTLHHIAGDGRSLLNLVKELLNTYELLCRGKGESSFTMPRSQYSDFVRWEQNLLNSPRGKALEAFWEKELEGWVTDLALPRSPGIRQDKLPHPDTRSIAIDNDLMQEVILLSQKTGTSFYTIAFSVFAILLHHYTEQDELVVGMPVSTLLSISGKAVDSSVSGYLVNPLVIRSVIADRYNDYLGNLESRISSALDNQAYPFYKIQQAYARKKGIRRPKLINAIFNYLNFQKEAELEPLIAPIGSNGIVNSGELSLSPFHVPYQESDRDLSMILIRTADSFNLSVAYDQRLFSPEAVDQKIDDYVRLLKAVTRAPHSDIQTLLEQSAVFGSPTLAEKSTESSVSITKADRFWAQVLRVKPDPVLFHGEKSLHTPAVTYKRSLVIEQERASALVNQARDRLADLQDLELSVFSILTGIIVVLVNKTSDCRTLPLRFYFHPERHCPYGDTQEPDLNGLPLTIGLSDGETVQSLHRKIAGNITLMLKYGEAARFSTDSAGSCPDGTPGSDAARIAIRFTPSLQSDHLKEGIQPIKDGADSKGNGLGFHIHWDRGKAAITMEFVFDETLFNSERQQSLIELFSQILDEFLNDENQAIETIRPISEEERTRLLKLGKSSKPNQADSTLIPELFRRQAKLTPDAIAVIAGERKLTYRELEISSDNIATELIRQGAGPDTLTGLCMYRSVDTMAALLGIFKSGSIYVPIDPELPQKRISYMIDDAGIGTMVTQDRIISAGLFQDHELIFILPESLSRQKLPQNYKPLIQDPDSPAYVIYTSGSTGNPKGIQVSRRSIARHCRNAAHAYSLSRHDRALQFFSLSFDASLELIFASLIVGATQILRDDTIWTPHECLDKVESYGITVLNFPPAYMKEFFKAYNAESSRTLGTLRLFITGGDVLHPRVLDMWRERFAGQTRLINAYGPTEATITAMHYEIPQGAESKVLHSVPIGRPLDGREVYVVDRKRHLVPAGIPGELILGGEDIAIGYLGRPELTREKFFNSTFSGRQSGRCYATGDRVRWRQDGNLEYLGRFDDQVKIRGFRIELGEIESCLMAHPDIMEASVVAVEGPDRNTELNAYFVCKDRGPNLEIYVKDRLPVYMIPRNLIELDRLPRLPSGKIDKKTLQSHEHSTALPPLRLPKDEVEAVVAAIWSNALGLNDISMDADFFESGGHSLLAVQILSKIHTTFQLDLTLADLFQTSRLFDFAGKVKAGLTKERIALEPLEKAGFTDKAPLSFGQKRLWFLDNFEGNSTVYSMPCALHITGNLDTAIVKKAFDEICRRHESLRITFKNEVGIPVQMIHERTEPEMKVFVCDGKVEADRILTTEAKRPFDLEKGPLLRIAVLQMAQESENQILFFNIHHIISDGWSIHVLLNEFTTLYTAFLNDAPSPLPELPIQYTDFGLWQKNVLEKSLYKPQLNYWKEKLRGLPPLLELPADKPRPSIQTLNGAIQSFTFNESLAQQVRDLSTRKGATLFMTFASVFSLLLTRYTGRDDIVTGFPVSGRHHDRTDQLIGFFVNTLALRVTIPGNGSFNDHLENVKQTVLDALNHQDIPFEKLIDELAVERNIQYPPLLQIIFSMFTVDFEDLFKIFESVEILEIENHTAKNDFTFFILNKGNILRGSIEYNTDLFTATTVRRIIADFKHLLQAALTEPDRACDVLLDSCDIFGSPAESPGEEGGYSLPAQSNLTKNQLLTYLGQTTKPDSIHYNNPHLYEIRGYIEPCHLMNAFDAVAAASDALQSRFVETSDGVPLRVHHKDLQSCEYIDLSGMDDSQFRKWITSRSCRIFDLTASLFDAVLIKRSTDFHVWFLNIHHIIIDGWSWNRVIIPLVSTLYRAACRGESPGINLNLAFESFSSWEKTYIDSQQYAADKQFWDYTFKAPHEPLTFYGDHPHKISTRLDRIIFRIGEQRTLKLRAIAESAPFFLKNLDVTLLHIAATLVLVFLHKISGNRNLSVGIPFHNRKAGENDEIIGLLMQTLPLRLSISDNDTFISLCNAISYKIKLMRRHSNYTLSNPHDTPNYDVLLNVIKLASPTLGDAAVSGGWTGPSHGYESLGFIITNDLSEPDLEIGIDFHSDVFDYRRQKKAVDHFLTILDCFLADPGCAIHQARILTSQEIHSIIHDFNRSEKVFESSLTVIDLIEKAAVSYPDRIAVGFDEQSITYAELDRQAEIVADYLAGEELVPEDGVGLLVDRSIELFIGIVGVLKAGCCYVPIDPEYPEQRKRFIAADAGLRVILTHSESGGRYLLDGLTTKEIRLILAAGMTASCPRTPARPENRIYITYTSGSTGMPKGVVVENGNLVNQYFAWNDAYNLSRTNAHLQMANFTFDVFSGDLVRGLCSGAKLVICRKETTADPEKLYQLMIKEGIDFAEFVPVVLRQLANYLQRKGLKLDFMKVLCCGSDTWYFNEYMEIKALCGETTRLVNSYGVTEATIDSSFFEVGNLHPDDNSLVPIGKPFANNRLYILDPNSLSPLPPGMTGELFIGGAGVSRGYLNQADLNAKGFITDPFADDQGATLFRTGDLARHLPDGTIALLGRIDNQLKIRGFRIEAGEIESALSSHPRVKESLVILREDRPGQKQLAAYLILQSSEKRNDLYTEFRDFLKHKVPDYMIPNHFILIENYPLLPNGKIDRKSLPEPASFDAANRYTPPSTPEELLLEKIWEEVLGIEKPGIHDNFFQLGGDSIISIQIAARAKQQGLVFSVKELFEFQTIHELARVAGKATMAHPDQKPVTGGVPLIPIQQAFFSHAGRDLHHYNQSVLVTVPETVVPEMMEAALNHLTAHHDALRLTFRNQGGKWSQEIKTERSDVVLENHQICDLASVAERLQKSIDIEQSHLVKAALFKDDAQKTCRLLIIIHHLAVDGVSWRILLSDLHAAYKQLETGTEIELPLKTTSFKQWAESWAEHTRHIHHDLGYWTTLHDRARYITPLDPDLRYHRTPNTMEDAKQLLVELDERLTESLLRDIHHAYNTRIQEILVASLVLALGRTTGNYTLVMNMEGHGRETVGDDMDLTRTVGWFTSIFPVVLSPGDSSIGIIIKYVKEQLRNIPSNGITYGYLPPVPGHDEKADPVQHKRQPEILFNYLGQFHHQRESDGFFQAAPEGTGPDRSSRQDRGHLLEINGHVIDGKLNFSIAYNRYRYREKTMESLARELVQGLESIITHCLDPVNQGFTPSDFSLINGISQKDLDDALARIPLLPGSTGIKDQIEDIYPLAPIQEGMLFYEQFDRKANLYLVQISGILEGDVDAGRMKHAYQSVLARHSILRSGFIQDSSGRFLQVVNRHVEMPFFSNDLTALPPEKQKIEIQKLVNDDTAVGFDFSRAPIMRCTLNKLDENRYHFILSNHHVLMDGWSTPLFFKELFSFYESAAQGQSPKLPTPGTYRQYISWLQQQNKGKAADYWKNYLKGFAMSTPLPGDRNPPHAGSFQIIENHADYELILPPDLSRDLVLFSQHNNLTLNTILQGAYAILLSRCGNEEDIVYGATATVRPADVAGIESMVGLFINTLPVRVKVVPNQELIAFLKDLMKNQAEREPYSFASLAEIQRCSNIPPGTPLFESIFVFQNTPVEDYSRYFNRDLRISDVRGNDNTNFALAVTGSPGTTITLHFTYDSDRFEAEDIKQMAEQYRTIVLSMLADPEKDICDIGFIRSNNDLPYLTAPRKRLYYQPRYAGKSHKYLAPRTSTEIRMKTLWEQVLEVKNAGVKDNFFESGGQSLLAVRLMTNMEYEFNKKIPLASLFDFPTIEGLSNLVDTMVGLDQWTPIVPFRKTGSRPPLFCVHPLGGTVFQYLDLAHLINSNYPIFGLQAKGTETDSTPLTDIRDMAQVYEQHIRALYPDSSCILLGWSFGGSVAFEIARRMEKDRKSVVLILLDSKAPQISVSSHPAFSSGDIEQLEQIKSIIAPGINLDPHLLKGMSSLEMRLKYFLETAREKEMVPAGFNMEQCNRFLNVCNAHARALNYAPEPFNGRIILLKAEENDCDDPYMGWEHLAVEGVQVIEVPGNHHTMLATPNVEILGKTLSRIIERTL